MTSLYILCPTIGCGELIPKRLRCRGTVVPEHKDLYFQSCKRCKHFEWAPPPSPEPYGLVPSGPDPFPRDTSYPSPPPPASPAIDPALQAPSSTFHAAAAAAAPSNDTSKRQCVNFRQCKKLATAKNCTNNMCKPCCGLKGTGWGHNYLWSFMKPITVEKTLGRSSALSDTIACVVVGCSGLSSALPVREASRQEREGINEVVVPVGDPAQDLEICILVQSRTAWTTTNQDNFIKREITKPRESRRALGALMALEGGMVFKGKSAGVGRVDGARGREGWTRLL
ncbi:hypothetical protein B0H13DRAFT_2262916 [Mycena leptocephala]|nr:hypothetical protein B0H13DRAFT_2262916 [Mycena leptocephala]